MDKCHNISMYFYDNVQTNESYDPYIEINKEAQQSLAVVIHRMFKIDPKEKNSSLQRMSDRHEEKGHLYENAYHISLTPSKIKKPNYALGKETSSKQSFKFAQNSFNNNSNSLSSRQRNNSYQ